MINDCFSRNSSQFVERRPMLDLLALSRFHEAHCSADKQEAFWLPCTSAHIIYYRASHKGTSSQAYRVTEVISESDRSVQPASQVYSF